jgi:hypothetical protein
VSATGQSRHSVIALCDELANTSEIEIGKGIAKLGHEDVAYRPNSGHSLKADF